MKQTLSSFISLAVCSLIIVAASMLLFSKPAIAANSLVLGSDDGVSNFMKLKAKVAYLTAWVEALQTGERTPAPTMVVLLDANQANLIGTIARDPDDTRVEICGPMEKGTVDWDDGTTESIVGLGCSGDTHEFVLRHTFAESGSYGMVVTDAMGRTKKHVIGVVVPE